MPQPFTARGLFPKCPVSAERAYRASTRAVTEQSTPATIVTFLPPQHFIFLPAAFSARSAHLFPHPLTHTTTSFHCLVPELSRKTAIQSAAEPAGLFPAALPPHKPQFSARASRLRGLDARHGGSSPGDRLCFCAPSVRSAAVLVPGGCCLYLLSPEQEVGRGGGGCGLGKCPQRTDPGAGRSLVGLCWTPERHNMLNPTNGDQTHMVNYVEDYLDSIESLPFDLQRNVSLMREIDAKYQEILKELDDYYEKFRRESDAIQKRRLLQFIQRALIRSQELGDDKIQIVSQMVELVENRTRQVDSHVELFETCQDLNDSTSNSSKNAQDKSKNEALSQTEKTSNKRSRRQRNNENRENATINHDHDDLTSGTPKEKKPKTSKKKKRSKAKAEREASPADLPIDPNEPTYCLCNQVSYGEMIGCDNEECPIEWFHFSCVGLNHKPKGKWYCPECRGENEKTMGKALEKSKKERAYNR